MRVSLLTRLSNWRLLLGLGIGIFLAGISASVFLSGYATADQAGALERRLSEVEHARGTMSNDITWIKDALRRIEEKIDKMNRR